MREFTLTGFAAFLGELAAELPKAEHEALEQAAVVVETEAKRVIGTYEYGWPQLSPATLAHKAADTPLLETGEMRESIEHTVGHMEAQVGSDDPKAVWQELGTRRGIPPRSFLMGAAMRKQAEVQAIIGEEFVAALTLSPKVPGGYGHWAGPATKIARQCHVSQPFVGKLREVFIRPVTKNVISEATSTTKRGTLSVAPPPKLRAELFPRHLRNSEDSLSRPTTTSACLCLRCSTTRNGRSGRIGRSAANAMFIMSSLGDCAPNSGHSLQRI